MEPMTKTGGKGGGGGTRYPRTATGAADRPDPYPAMDRNQQNADPVGSGWLNQFTSDRIPGSGYEQRNSKSFPIRSIAKKNREMIDFYRSR